jgi:hypothetical protein
LMVLQGAWRVVDEQRLRFLPRHHVTYPAKTLLSDLW